MVAVRDITLDTEAADTRPALRLLDGRSPRRDALPEHTSYADTGCTIHSSCLTCPLVRCRYDEPGGARKLLSDERDRSILALRRQGRPISVIANRFGVSRRTVFRALAHARVS
jgi:transcriptional regulator of acetoin/glycerol metabolism